MEWDRIKAQERAARGETRAPVFKALPPRLPALMFAEAVWKQLRKAGLAAPGADPARVAAAAEGMDDSALGRRLFELAAAARERGLDPEGALRRHASAVMEDAAAGSK